MRIPRIHTQQQLTSGSSIQLEEAPSRHLAKALRMDVGRELILFNGQGGEFQAAIAEVSKKSVTVTVGQHINKNRSSPLAIHLGIGLSKGERFEFVLQKAAELGVTQITPLFTERTEIKLTGPRLDKKLASWQQTILSACEQCQLNMPTQLNAPLKFDQWIDQRHEQKRFVLHHRADAQLGDKLKVSDVALAIGPEGGLSADEISKAEANDFESLRLGPRVLRTETAPIVAVSILQLLWGDLS